MKELLPAVTITLEMIEKAKTLIPQTQVNRTIASKIDTLTGHLGEFVFAQWLYGDWRKNSVGSNKGKADFDNIEIKTSAFPFNENLNLLVRQDYAQKRKPTYYVQIIIDVPTRKATEILPNTVAYICGFATAAMVDAAPLRDFGSKIASSGGYLCHYIAIRNLQPMGCFLK